MIFKGLFEKYAHILGKGIAAREKIAEVIEAKTGRKIATDKISIKGDTVFIITAPTEKVAIRIQEANILDSLSTFEFTKSIRHIR